MNVKTAKRMRIILGLLIAAGLYYYFFHYYPEKMRHKYFRSTEEADEFWKNVTK
jgi:hypothetical protein